MRVHFCRHDHASLRAVAAGTAESKPLLAALTDAAFFECLHDQVHMHMHMRIHMHYLVVRWLILGG